MVRRKVPWERRKRVRKACVRCKQRRHKCSESRPCKSCADAGKPCIWGDLPVRYSQPKLDNIEVEPSESGYQSASDSGVGGHVGIEVFPQLRVLRTPKGGHVAMGEASILSFLESVRATVEEACNFPAFTSDKSFSNGSDPNRNDNHQLSESYPETNLRGYPSCPLPELEIAQVLAKSYFLNTQGLCEAIDQCEWNSICGRVYRLHYADETADILDWVLVYLVLAIGRVFFKPSKDSVPADQPHDFLQGNPYEKAEFLACTAKRWQKDLDDYTETDVRIIQSHFLTSLYQLALHRWDASYLTIWKAVACANAAGLPQLDRVANKMTVTREQKLWRSLVIWDALLSASMGRDAAAARNTGFGRYNFPLEDPNATNHPTVQEQASRSVFRSCLAIHKTIDKIYPETLANDLGTDDSRGWNVSTQTGTHFLEDAVLRDESLPKALDAARIVDEEEQLSDEEVVALMHLDIVESYVVILTARPFFLFEFHGRLNGNPKQNGSTMGAAQLNLLTESCVAASNRLISVAHVTVGSGRLTSKNAFMIHLIWNAALLLVSNEFASLCTNPRYEESLKEAMDIFGLEASSCEVSRRIMIITGNFYEAARIRRGSGPSRRASLPGQATGSTSPSGSETGPAKSSKGKGKQTGIKRSKSFTTLQSIPSMSRASVTESQAQPPTGATASASSLASMKREQSPEPSHQSNMFVPQQFTPSMDSFSFEQDPEQNSSGPGRGFDAQAGAGHEMPIDMGVQGYHPGYPHDYQSEQETFDSEGGYEGWRFNRQ